MGKLTCSRCGGSFEHSNFNIAVESLDHGIGKTNGHPCPNDPTEFPLFWDGKAVHVIHGKPQEPITPKSDTKKESKDEGTRSVPAKQSTVPSKKTGTTSRK